MNVTFVLPGFARVPVGGYKVVFEYANRLATRGHAVALIFPALLDQRCPLPHKAYRLARYLVRSRINPRLVPWFDLHPQVAVTWVPSLAKHFLPDADAIVATGWTTAESVAGYGTAKGRKFYLIQACETWWGEEPRVVATWRLPLEKIVVARWLEEIAKKLGEPSHYVPNAVDVREFAIDVPIHIRNPHRVSMLYHQNESKRSADGLEALRIAHTRVPSLRASLFGVFPCPCGLPGWIEYVRNPSRAQLRALYNQTSVFLASSSTEGWPLPPAEAMMSGCALLATDIGGHREYAVPDVTALLAPPRRPDDLASQLVLLLTDESRRLRIASAGRDFVRRFTWDLAISRIEMVLASPSAHAQSREGAMLIAG